MPPARSHPPIEYEALVTRVNIIVETWGGDKKIRPGWTPREWAEDFLTRISGDVWKHQKPNCQRLTMAFIQDPELSSDIHSTKFPSVEQLVTLRRLSFVDVPDHYARRHSWLRSQTERELAAWSHKIYGILQAQGCGAERLWRLTKHYLQVILDMEKTKTLEVRVRLNFETLDKRIRERWPFFTDSEKMKCAATVQACLVLRWLLSSTEIDGAESIGLSKQMSQYYYPTLKFLNGLCSLAEWAVEQAEAGASLTPYDPQARYLTQAAPHRHPLLAVDVPSLEGSIPLNPLATSEQSRLAIGWISVGYTFQDHGLQSSHNPLMPGSEAFRTLHWIFANHRSTHFVTSAERDRERPYTAWLLRHLLQDATIGTLPPYTRLPHDFAALRIRYAYSNCLGPNAYLLHAGPPKWHHGAHTEEQLEAYRHSAQRERLFGRLENVKE